MYPYNDLWEYVYDLEKEGELRRIKVDFDPKYELAALHRVLAKYNGPAVLVEYDHIPLLTWIWASFKRIAKALGMNPENESDARQKSIEKIANSVNEEWIRPKIVNTGKCKEVIITEEEVDLRVLPHIWGVEGELNPYITLGITVSKDRETGIYNSGIYRHGFRVFNPETGKSFPEEDHKRFLCSYIVPGMNHAGIHYSKLKNGEPLQIAICIGVEPTTLIAAATCVDYGYDELALAGYLRGKPLEVVKCETTDLCVPANAHIVIEAEVQPGYPEVAYVDTPIAEFYGYLNRDVARVTKTKVKCITMAKNPVWPMTVELHQPPPYEHVSLLNVTETATLYSVKKWVPFISKIVVPIPPGSIHNGIAIVQLEKKPYPFYARLVMRALWSTKGGQWLKYIIVVDSDIDPYDWDSVIQAFWNRVQPSKDILIYDNMPQVHGWDPSIQGITKPMPFHMTTVGQSQMGIDATVKVPERFGPEADPRTTKAEPSKELVEKVYNKIKDYIKA